MASFPPGLEFTLLIGTNLSVVLQTPYSCRDTPILQAIIKAVKEHRQRSDKFFILDRLPLSLNLKAGQLGKQSPPPPNPVSTICSGP